MAKSSSLNTNKECRSKTLPKFIAVFLAIQAGLLVAALIVNYASISLEAFFAIIIWAIASILAAGLQIYPYFTSTSAQEAGSDEKTSPAANILGSPGKNFDLPSLCAMLQEGVALLQDGQIIYANQSLAYGLAAQEEELLGTKLDTYIHPEDASLINLDDISKQETGIARSTLRLLTQMGDVRWVICSAHKVLWQDKEAILLLFENIAALKEAQQALEEQEYQSRIFLERTPLGIAMFGAMGQLKLSNTSWHSIWSNIVGNSGRRFNILQDSFLPNTPVEQAIRQAFNKKDTGVSKFEHATPWGETRWLNLNFHPMTDPMGKLIGVAMIQQDITDQVRSLRRENELTDQLTTLKHEISYYGHFITQIQDEAKHIIISFMQDGTVASWNKAAEQRFGLSKNEVLGLHYKKLDINLSPYISMLQATLADNKTRQTQHTEICDKSGPHYEKITAHSTQFGFKHLIMLEIKDITHEIFKQNMLTLLEPLTAKTGTEITLEKAPESSSVSSGIQQNSDGMPQNKNTNTPDDLQHDNAQKCNIASMQTLLDQSIQIINAETDPKANITSESAPENLTILGNSKILTQAISSLGKILLSFDFKGQEPNLSFNQSQNATHAIITLSTSGLDVAGLTDFSALPNALDMAASASKGPYLRKLVEAIQSIAVCGGVIGAYSDAHGASFICHFPLSGIDALPPSKPH